ncbi:MAG: DNA cytosine methyltransferase [Eubacteriales bacterium]|nr:DNA cytosine methyltransferase [Eubacteriales bacterium]MDD4513745.1 DNA cytosine methyltransferase [Eubacteriales bacterium]
MNYATLGSLFDGSGGFPLAGVLNGITPVWASEIEPYPIAVTSSRFPMMRHLGSVTEINGGEIPPVDIITFGSPCQDMSVAGRREGMKHKEHGADDTTRSGLFYEAARVIREMRESTNGRHPTFAIWENVPGAFTSNKGEDFRCVLETLCGIVQKGVSIPRPDKWKSAGFIAGGGIAWRGASSTRNFGEYPSVARGSILSQILEANAPLKYYLSAKACQGILRRAERRGKELPSILRQALEEAVAIA